MIRGTERGPHFTTFRKGEHEETKNVTRGKDDVTKTCGNNGLRLLKSVVAATDFFTAHLLEYAETGEMVLEFEVNFDDTHTHIQRCWTSRLAFSALGTECALPYSGVHRCPPGSGIYPPSLLLPVRLRLQVFGLVTLHCTHYPRCCFAVFQNELLLPWRRDFGTLRRATASAAKNAQRGEISPSVENDDFLKQRFLRWRPTEK